MAIRGSVKDGKYMERMGEGEGEGEGFEDYKLIALYVRSKHTLNVIPPQ